MGYMLMVGKDGKRRYHCWAGEPDGYPENPLNCIVSVPEGGRSCLSRQCKKKRGQGRNGLFCGIHAKQDSKRPFQGIK